MNPDPMHRKLIRRAQRLAALPSGAEDARRLARLEVEVEALGAQVTLDSIVLGTTKAHLTPEPGVITAQTRRSDEATCAALAALIWTPAERLALGALTADTDER